MGNSGVAQRGGSFLGLNYGRLARLRAVTGYPGAWDWTVGVKHPEDDGIFRVDVKSGEMRLIVSYAQLRDALRESHPLVEETPLFINHTLWNREDDRIYFYARGNFSDKPRQINAPFCVDPDGGNLTMMTQYIGGHPDWKLGRRIIGSSDGRQVIYDTDKQEIVETLGDRDIFPSPGGDIALSPDGRRFVNGYVENDQTRYVILERETGAVWRTPFLDQHGWTRKAELRNDPAPAWNRDGTQILFPSITQDAEQTRQLFVIDLKR